MDRKELLLCSRYQTDLLLVTFHDLQRCLEKAFVDLSDQEDSSSSGGGNADGGAGGNGAAKEGNAANTGAAGAEPAVAAPRAGGRKPTGFKF